jgi:hypothetical protein
VSMETGPTTSVWKCQKPIWFGVQLQPPRPLLGFPRYLSQHTGVYRVRVLGCGGRSARLHQLGEPPLTRQSPIYHKRGATHRKSSGAVAKPFVLREAPWALQHGLSPSYSMYSGQRPVSRIACRFVAKKTRIEFIIDDVDCNLCGNLQPSPFDCSAAARSRHQ